MTENRKGWIERSGSFFEKDLFKKRYALLQKNNRINVEFSRTMHVQ